MEQEAGSFNLQATNNRLKMGQATSSATTASAGPRTRSSGILPPEMVPPAPVANPTASVPPQISALQEGLGSSAPGPPGQPVSVPEQASRAPAASGPPDAGPSVALKLSGPSALGTPQVTSAPPSLPGNVQVPAIHMSRTPSTLMNAQHTPPGPSEAEEEKVDGVPLHWTQHYRPDVDSDVGSDEDPEEMDMDANEAQSEEEEIEDDIRLELAERIKNTAGDFKTRAELFERCGYDLPTILEVVKAAVGSFKSTAGRISYGVYEEEEAPDDEEEAPDDEEWASRVLSAPYYPGDLMDNLTDEDAPLETYETFWTRQGGTSSDFIHNITAHDDLFEDGNLVFYDSDPDSSCDTEDSGELSDEDMSTDDSDAEEEEEYEHKRERDEMRGLERLDDEGVARMYWGKREVTPVASDKGSMGTAQGGTQSMLVDAVVGEASTSAMDEGAMAETSPPAITTYIKCESPSSRHAQHRNAIADRGPTPLPSSGQKRSREQDAEEQQDTTQSSGGYGGVKGLKLMGYEGRFRGLDDSDTEEEEEEEEERRVDPGRAPQHVRHKMEVLKLILGPTHHLSEKKRKKIESQLRLLTQCDEWLTSLESEAGPSGGGHQSRMLLDCLDQAIRDVSMLRRLDVHKAVYRAEEALTEREIAEEQTDEAMEEGVLNRLAFSRLVAEVVQDFRTELHVEPEAMAAIQAACEAHVVELFTTANSIANQSGRDHLKAGDLVFAQRLDYRI